MNGQVLSIEQMQHLKELGIDTSKASCYIWESEGKEYLYWGKCEDANGIPTFTLQDILELLPKSIITKDFHNDNVYLIADFFSKMIGYAYSFETCGEISFYKHSEFQYSLLIESAYDMLCWCIENGFVK